MGSNNTNAVAQEFLYAYDVSGLESNLYRLTENAGILPLGIHKQKKASEISLVI